MPGFEPILLKSSPPASLGKMPLSSNFEQTFLENVTNIRGIDFATWNGWQALMDWINRQSWRRDFMGGEKIPSRLLHPASLTKMLIRYLGGRPEN